ncbi:MAG TPA: CAAX prenyl protease-related protein, partial [Pyrinomonadaceae bacterium]|nr:CAAX prenyl protease-related protein [Pyrinomonadaceae bacterium]
MAVFLVFTLAESAAGGRAYVLLYVLKVCAVTAALYACRSTSKDVKISARVLAPAVGVGLLVFAQWVLLDKYVNYYRLGSRAAFNPFEAVADPALRLLFMVARFYGLVLVVPLMEELFWRSFLLRYFTSHKFEKVPLGAFSWPAFAVVAVGFALSHPEWLPALFTACAYA